jgi:DNA-binding Lrp family transcriptional regulator
MSLPVRAVERALDILLSFTGEEPTRSLTQIAESVHLSKPTVHRLLATLEKKRFIAKENIGGRYRLDVQFHRQPVNIPGNLSSATLAKSPDKIQKGESDRSAVVEFVAAAISKDPQTSTGFNRVGANQARAGAWKMQTRV